VTALSATALLGLVAVLPAQASLNKSLFELDKNAGDNTKTTKVAVVASAIAASGTTIQLCQSSAADPTGWTLLIDAERMTVSSFTSASGGGCPSGFPTKRNYVVTRGVNGTTPAAHAKAEDVTRLEFPTLEGADWDAVYADRANECSSIAGAVTCSYIHDGRGQSVFTTGGSKDDLDVPSWRWTNSSVPDADEIDDAFAIKYDVNNEQTLFFGSDRFATNGAKDMGFWFFHQPVGTNTDGTFSGNHTVPVDTGNDGFCGISGRTNPVCPSGGSRDANDTAGDILILSTFTQGGAVTTVRIFEWVGAPYGNATAADTVYGPVGSFGDCVPGTSTDNGCATVNDTTIESPWSYLGKSEVSSNEIASGGFLEGGINLTALHLGGCFSSFLAETRSAPSVDAQLKDFVLGNFEACGASVVTTPQDGAGTDLTDSNDNDVPDVQIGTGADGVDVQDSAELSVTGTSNFSGTLSFFLCGPIASGTCTTGGVPAGSTDVTSNGTYPSDTVNLTEVGRYCWRGDFASDTPGLTDGASDASEGECFEVLPVTPTLTTTAVDSSGTALSGPVDFGLPLYDKATLSGTAYEPGTDGDGDANGDYTSINATMDTPAKGSISFELRGPDGASTDCTTVAAALSGTTGSNPESVDVNGDNDYMTTGFTPDAPGDYHWVASYTGDSPNTESTDHNTDCSVGAENVTVQQIPTEIKTKQSWYPQDTATITSSVTGDDLEAGGTVDFYLYDNATCDGDSVYSEQATLTGGSHSEEVSTDNTTFAVTTAYDDAADSVAGPYSWLVVYTPASGDTAHTGIQSVCDAEHFSVTYTNDAGPGSALS
jgi:hypothetical protein